MLRDHQQKSCCFSNRSLMVWAAVHDFPETQDDIHAISLILRIASEERILGGCERRFHHGWLLVIRPYYTIVLNSGLPSISWLFTGYNWCEFDSRVACPVEPSSSATWKPVLYFTCINEVLKWGDFEARVKATYFVLDEFVRVEGI